MYFGFKITNLSEKSEIFNNNFEYYKNKGKENEISDKIQENFENYSKELIIDEEGQIDVEKLKNHWFSEIETTIFVSHSHKDKELALAFSGWIREKLNINVFLDYYAWGSADKLLKIIDNKYSKKSKNLYDYNKRNLTTTHVHNILFNAMMKTIFKNKYFFLLKTENSLTDKDKTDSAWIYSEIEFFNILCESSNISSKGENFSYSPDTNKLKKLEVEKILELSKRKGDFLLNLKKYK